MAKRASSSDYLPKKSKTCVSASGEPLTEYASERDARDGAHYLSGKAGGDFVPYRCPKCAKWHVSPKARVTPGTIGCTCKDAKGESKTLYLSRRAAEGRAKIIAEERGLTLYVYECPARKGWHLSHQKY